MHSLHPWILLDITWYLTTKTCMMLECTNLFQGENNAGSSSIPVNEICSTQTPPLAQGRAWKYSSSENTSEVDCPLSCVHVRNSSFRECGKMSRSYYPWSVYISCVKMVLVLLLDGLREGWLWLRWKRRSTGLVPGYPSCPWCSVQRVCVCVSVR